MGRSVRWILSAALGGTLAACGSGGVSVERNYSPDTDFDRYLTYAWSTESGELTRSSAIDEATDVRIRGAIDREMGRAGYTRVPMDQRPQLTVGYVVTLDRQAERRGNPDAAEVDRYGGVYDSSPTDRWIERGILEVGIVDPRESRVIWRGIANTELGAVRDVSDRERRIAQVVGELFKGFPPR